MENPIINSCKCGSSNVRMRSFKHDFYGFYIECKDCNLKIYDKAIPVNNPDSKNVQILAHIQNSLVYKWNIESRKT